MEVLGLAYNDEIEDQQVKKKRGGIYYLIGFIGFIIGGFIITIFNIYILPLINTNSHIKQVTSTSVSTNNQSSIENAVTTMIEGAQKSIVQIGNYDPEHSNNKDGVVGTGSGVIYKINDNSAYIITNNHVIQNAKKILVTLSNETSTDAKLVGADQLTDLAILEIKSDQVDTIADLGDSKNNRVGDRVFAIGNPLGLTGTVTSGIISSTKRSVPMDLNGDNIPDWEEELIQTDASINPGNSGGGLFNTNGNLIGINSSKISQNSIEGIGFAIPIDTVKNIAKEIEKNGKVKRPTIGVQLKDLAQIPPTYTQNELKLPTDIKDGVVIIRVENDSPAFNGGLQTLDVIVGIDDKPIKNIIDIKKYLYNHKEGNKIKINLYRQQNKEEKYIILEDK